MKNLILVVAMLFGNLCVASSEVTTAEAVSEAETPLVEKAVEKTVEKAAPIAEDSIPVNISQPKMAGSTESTTNRLVILVGILVTLSGVAYFITKKFGRPGSSQQTQIKVLTQHYLGPKKSLAIVRVAGESILIGITDQSINMIKSLSLLDDEVPEVTPMNFEKTLQASEKVQSSGSEEFSMRHIKDVVSLKLKGIGKDT
jgi:flagellar protein FliO/FliZ